MTSSLLPDSEIVDPRCGSTLNERYRIVKRIGVGGMGVVYEGLHLIIQRRVAIKMLHAEYTRNGEILARFRREAIAATTIRHPHIVEVLDMGTSPDGAAYMVLEFLDGRDWADDIEKQGAQPLGKTVRILRQVCDGLQAAHDKNIVHRDLKPENIYLSRHGSNDDHVKIVDFGISKMIDQPDATPEPGKAQQALTKTGAAMGTPYAMAPEQMMGQKDVDHRADLWAIGVILFRALTASYPFDAETFPLLAVSVLTGDPQSLSKFRGDLPPEIQQIVSRLLEKDRARRFQSAREIRDALAPFESFESPAPAASAAPLRSALGIAATMTPATPLADPAPAAPPPPAISTTTVGHRVTPRETPSIAPPAPAPVEPAPPRTSTPTSSMAAAPPARQGPGIWSGALLAVVLLALGGGGAIAAIHALETPGASPPPTSTVPAPPTVAAPPATTPVPTVRLQITTVPPDAELLLNGQRVPNPFDGDLPASSEMHTIVASAEGYRSETRQTPLEFPMRVTLELERESARPHGTTHPTHDAPHASTVETPVAHVEVPATRVEVPPAHVEPPPPTRAEPPPTTTTERPGLLSPFHH